MKRIMRFLALIGGVVAVGWVARRRLLSAGMGKEPVHPEPVPEPVPATAETADPSSAPTEEADSSPEQDPNASANSEEETSPEKEEEKPKTD